MYIGMTHTHVASVLLFFLLYLIKTILLLANKNDALALFSRRTRLVEGIVGLLMVGTGVYLYFTSAFKGELWLTLKLVGILVFFAVGMKAFRSGSKLLATFNLFLFFYLYVISNTKTLTGRTTWVEEAVATARVAERTVTDPLQKGRVVYEQVCAPCHGADGTATHSGATPLKSTRLSFFEIPQVIKEGRKTMPAFGEYLTDEEIQAVAKYVIYLTRSDDAE